MTTVGRWSPNKVRARVLDGTWVSPEELGGMVLLTPTSISYTGTSATVGANGSVTATACSSLSLNGVFSADYDNYAVIVTGTSSYPSSSYGRLRSSGTDASGNNYIGQFFESYGSTVAAARGGLTDAFRPFYLGTVGTSASYLMFHSPYKSAPTTIGYRSMTAYDASAKANDLNRNSTHNVSASYDGFTFYAPTWTFTATLSVCGLVGA